MLMNATLLHPGPPNISDLAHSLRVVSVTCTVVTGSVIGTTDSLFEDTLWSLEIFSCIEETLSLKVAVFSFKTCCWLELLAS